MEYSLEEWSWVEAEWAFHCHGRSAFISPEDFRHAKAWAIDGVPAEALVAAMGSFFERRAKRPRPRAFVAFSHLKRDVEKAMSFRRALARAGEALETGFPAWDSVRGSLKSDPRAKATFEAWMRLRGGAPLPESPGYLDYLDLERVAKGAFVEIAAEALGASRAALEAKLSKKLLAADIKEDTAVWKRAWEHHFSKDVCAAWGLDDI
jgi:hypothetical protein